MKFIPVTDFVKNVRVHKADPADKPEGSFTYDELSEPVKDRIMAQAASDPDGVSYHFSPPSYCYDKDGNIACQDDGSAIRID